MLLCEVGAVFGEGQVLLFVAGAALGKCLNVRLGSKRCIQYQKKNVLGSSKSNLACEAGCGLRFHGRIMVGSFSDHARIIFGSFSHRSHIGNDVSAVVRKSARCVWRKKLIAPRIVNEISYVTRMNYVCHFSWQA